MSRWPRGSALDVFFAPKSVALIGATETPGSVGRTLMRNLLASPGSRAAVSQVDGGRWLTLEGPATVTDDPARVAEGVRRYAERYRQPGERDDRVVIEIAVDRILGRA